MWIAAGFPTYDLARPLAAHVTEMSCQATFFLFQLGYYVLDFSNVSSLARLQVLRRGQLRA
jgi:hypothetical protein